MILNEMYQLSNGVKSQSSVLALGKSWTRPLHRRSKKPLKLGIAILIPHKAMAMSAALARVSVPAVFPVKNCLLPQSCKPFSKAIKRQKTR